MKHVLVFVGLLVSGCATVSQADISAAVNASAERRNQMIAEVEAGNLAVHECAQSRDLAIRMARTCSSEVGPFTIADLACEAWTVWVDHCLAVDTPGRLQPAVPGVLEAFLPLVTRVDSADDETPEPGARP